MIIRGALKNHGPYNKFIVLVGLILFSGGIATVLGSLLSKSLYGIDVVSIANVKPGAASAEMIAALKLLQTLMSVGTFILPPILAAFLFSEHAPAYLRTDKSINVTACLLVIALLFAAVPFINFTVNLNEKLQLPATLKSVEEWMKNSEARAAELTEAFFADTSMANLFSNLLIIAVIPAIGEELLFRGLIQRLFMELTNRKVLSIVLTAVLFSALHMQFYGFLPRFLLGVVFGFLLEWSGSLWLPVLGHFINNAGAVVFAWLKARGELGFDPDTVGAGPSDTLLLFISLVLVSLVLYYIRKISLKTGVSAINHEAN